MTRQERTVCATRVRLQVVVSAVVDHDGQLLECSRGEQLDEVDLPDGGRRVASDLIKGRHNREDAPVPRQGRARCQVRSLAVHPC